MTDTPTDIDRIAALRPAGPSVQTRVRSKIKFPYSDQDEAKRVASNIHEHTGMECTTVQLADWFNQPPNSGTFKQRISAAQLFGFAQTGPGGKIRLTSLGRRVVDPNQEKQARAEAFLSVPLYRAIHDKYKGYTLPPSDALEQDIVTLGVPPKQAARARIAFERSATQAGYFRHASNRLVEPAFKDSPDAKPLHELENKDGGNDVNDNGGKAADHPFIQGLVLKLPPPETTWDTSERAKWLQTATQIFGLMYQDNGGEITINYEPSDEQREIRIQQRTEVQPRPVTHND